MQALSRSADAILRPLEAASSFHGKELGELSRNGFCNHKAACATYCGRQIAAPTRKGLG